jgi:hypothetical protein
LTTWVLLPDTGRHHLVPHQLPRRAHAGPDAVALRARCHQLRLRRRRGLLASHRVRRRRGLLASHRGRVEGACRAPRRHCRANEARWDAHDPRRRVRAQDVAARLRGHCGRHDDTLVA